MPSFSKLKSLLLIIKTLYMKNHLLILFSLLGFFANAQTSIYHPFPDSAAQWNIQWNQGLCLGNDNYSITVSGDTIINLQTYHKLFTPFIQITNSSCTSGVLAGYRGAIRQDTIARKVFYIPPTNLSEQLLYDFTMQVGDTVAGFIETFAGSPDTVVSIDSVLVGTTYRKRWEINSWYNIYFIEGIGSTYGLLERSLGYATDQPFITITCFQQNSQALYPNTSGNCPLIDGIVSEEISSDQLIVFPNPIIDIFNISVTSNETMELTLYDFTSRVLLHQEFVHAVSLNMEQLAAGIYFYEVKNKNAVICNGKVVKE